MSKSEDLNQLRQDVRKAVSEMPCCQGKTIVFGIGSSDADVVMIGEAPGAQEDKAGQPFIGPAGKQLNELLEKAGLDREKLWITNVVKCRPTQENNGRLKNRPPTADEHAAFLPWLERELEILQPKMIICLGATAARALLNRKTVRMGEVRGEIIQSRFGIDAIVTYHPSYLLRLTSQREERYQDMVSDLVTVREYLENRE